jgi:hypothetical protein
MPQRFPTTPYEGSTTTPSSIPSGFDRMVLFVGKFADIKRIDCLLRAAVIYEKGAASAGLRVATIIAGSGPLEQHWVRRSHGRWRKTGKAARQPPQSPSPHATH